MLTSAIFGMLLEIRPVGDFFLLFPYSNGHHVGGMLRLHLYNCAIDAGAGREQERSSVLVCVAVHSLMLPLALNDTFTLAWDHLLIVPLSGGISSATQLLNTKAYGLAPARTLSVCEYTQLPFAAILGWNPLRDTGPFQPYWGLHNHHNICSDTANRKSRQPTRAWTPAAMIENLPLLQAVNNF